jgi:protein TonB
MNAAIKTPSPLAERSPFWARPANRLGASLFLAALAHLALLLGMSFTFDKPRPISQTLEITLSTFKSADTPDKPDFLAQDDQQGSGTLEHKAVPSTPELAPFKDTTIKPVAAQPAPPPTPRPPTPKAALATTTPQPQQAPVKRTAPPPEPPPAPAPTFDRSQLSAEIASLEADLSLDQQLYAKRDKVHRLTAASTMHDKGAWYKEAWRKKVERIGNLNYPDAARREGIHGSLRLLVSINRDGSLFEVLVLESSGQPLLDQAARRIVQLAAPFAALTGDLAEFDRLEIIRTWRFERGDRLSSQ